jgi:hypothetical protein
MPNDGYCVEQRGAEKWAVVRKGTPRAAAGFPTQSEAIAYLNKLAGISRMEISEDMKWQQLAQKAADKLPRGPSL